MRAAEGGVDERGNGRLAVGGRCGVLMFWGRWYGALGGAIVAAERVGRRRRVGAKDFVCLRV